MFRAAGAVRLYAKPLAENDNSKNQVYFGTGFGSLNILPNRGIEASADATKSIFVAGLDFAWLAEDGSAVTAPHAKMILYPQYPEVRFSGFLKGCATAPSAFMAGRMRGRVLFLGVTAARRILGFAAGPGSAVVNEIEGTDILRTEGVFSVLPLDERAGPADPRELLLAELGRIHRAGWIESKQLGTDGRLRPCRAPQCGGFTLEAELNIPKNSFAEPDFLGWEVKQHAVPAFGSPGGAITLMTPEPTGGFYKREGVEAFIRAYGYPDKRGVRDRWNFGGIHRVGHRHSTTGLRMELAGYDRERGKLADATGSLALVDATGNVAAEWAFSGLLSHWSRKHSKAVYVPSMRRTAPEWQYAYGPRIRLAEETDPLRLLAGLACGAVYYDPGIKLEEASTRPHVKRRSQFRIASKEIGVLYARLETVDL